MDKIIKKYFSILIGLFLVFLSFLFARGVNGILSSELLLVPKINVKESKKETGTALSPTTQSFTLSILDRNLFNLLLKKSGEVKDEDDEEKERDNEELSDKDFDINLECKSPLKAVIVATFVAEKKTSSVVSLRKTDSSEVVLLHDGMIFEDVVISYIANKQVYFKRNGKLECLEVKEEGVPKTAKPSHPTQPGSRHQFGREDRDKFRNGIKRIGKGEYEVERNLIEEHLDMKKLSLTAGFVPAYKDGNYTGFKLMRVRATSILRYMGLRSGDVIQRINDYEINTPQKAVTAFDQIRSSSGTMSIDYERYGRKQTNSYKLK